MGIQGNPEVYRFTDSFDDSRAHVLIARPTDIDNPSVNATASTIEDIRNAYRFGFVLGQQVRFSPTQQRFIPVNARFVPTSNIEIINPGTALNFIHLVCYSRTQFSYESLYNIPGTSTFLQTFRVRIIDYSAVGMDPINLSSQGDPRAYYEPIPSASITLTSGASHLYYTKVFPPGYYALDMRNLNSVATANVERIRFTGDFEYRLSDNND